MPHTKDDAVLRTSGKSWHWLPLPKPKTQIRLLHFRPGLDDDDISADIEVHDLDAAPAFNAISYTWGTEPPQSAIMIYDVPVFVRPNCHYALWQARLHFPRSRVWLDAICIDQSDLAEKAEQVVLMGDIYAKATNVLACIGPADDSSDGIRDALADLDAIVQDLPRAWFDSMDVELWRPPQDEATTVQLLEHFNNFVDRTYFSRVWIIQELFCGRDRIIALCGSYQLNLDTLVDLSRRLCMVFGIWRNVPYSGNFNWRLDRLNRLLTLHDSSQFALSRLLDEIGHFECEDVRDRIFGTIRLIDWAHMGKAPVPDYQIPPIQLALELMSLIDVRDMSTPFRIVHALLIEDKDQGFETWLRNRCRTMGRPTISPSPPGNKGIFTNIQGAHVIQRDVKGRLSVALEAGSPAPINTLRVLERLGLSDVPGDLNSAFAEHGLVPIFTSNDISVLACGEASPEDIILIGNYSDLVLRALNDGLRFIVVGPAIVVNVHGSRQGDYIRDCNCWQDTMNSYQPEAVEVAVNVSDEDALAAIGSRTAVDRDKGDILTYLKHHSLGKLIRGTILTDVTMSNLGRDRIIGPPQALCARHQTGKAEQYRVNGQALRYNIALDNGAYIYVSK